MRLKRIVLWASLILVGLPVAALLAAFIWISFLDRSSGVIVSSGETREYLLHVPPSYDGAEPTPLVISMHALATWPAQQMNLSGWNRLADDHGFIVVYPSGSRFPKQWHTIEPGPGLQRDVEFISDLIDAVGSTYNIDPKRVYANGMSNGGGMAFVLGCGLADRVAAVGLVAAAQALPPSWCPGGRPVPMIAFHGDADPIVPYEGGPLGDPFNPIKPVFPAVLDWVTAWARRNGCAAGPRESKVGADVRRTEYSDCAEDASVVLYTLPGGGHSWPGGKPLPEWWVGPTSKSIDATSQMWTFFGRHRLPGRADPEIPASGEVRL